MHLEKKYIKVLSVIIFGKFMIVQYFPVLFIELFLIYRAWIIVEIRKPCLKRHKVQVCKRKKRTSTA